MAAVSTTGCTAVFSAFLLMWTSVHAFVETPKFSQLRLLYPGYPEYGGHYHYDKLMFFILGPVVTDGDSSADALQLARHHTAAVRMSYALNRYGGRHAIGTEPIQLTRHPSSPVDSFAGRDRQQVIFRNEAFGPFLAARYGNPEVVRTATDDDSGITNRKPSSSAGLMSQFAGRQGIVRIVSFRRHNENGHVALWDCDRFYQSRDWSNEDHVIAVEFWESADSNCPSTTYALDVLPPLPAATGTQDDVDGSYFQLLPRHNFRPPAYLHDNDNDGDNGGGRNNRQLYDVLPSSDSVQSLPVRRRTTHGQRAGIRLRLQ